MGDNMEEKKHVKVSVIKLSIVVVCAVVILVTAGVVYNFYKKPKAANENNDGNTKIDIEEKAESVKDDEKTKAEDKNEGNDNDVTAKRDNANENKTNNDTNINNKKVNNQENISSNATSNKTTNQVNLNDYVGSWYESYNHTTDNNPSNLKIKKIDGNKMVMELYISRIANFSNFEVNMNENTGKVEAITDNGSSSDGKTPKMSATIELSNNTVTINVTSSNILYIESGTKYTFTYKIQNINLDGYNGNWYESSRHASDLNPNNINIRKIDAENVLFDLYITRTAQFDDVSVIVSENSGKFEAITENGRSTNDEQAKISGRIEFKNNNIILHVEKSNVFDLDSGKVFTFTYKGM